MAKSVTNYWASGNAQGFDIIAWERRVMTVKRALSCAVLGLVYAGSVAQASAADRPFFRASSLVIVIGGSDFSENAGEAPVAYDFYLLDNVTPATAAPDIIGADGVTINYNTGQFNASSNGSTSGYEFEVIDPVSGGTFNSVGPHQTLDANDSYNAFGVDDTTGLELTTNNRASQFLVVSNAAFDIYGEASDLTSTGAFSTLGYENIGYRIRLRQTGGNATWGWGSAAQNPGNGGSGVITAVNDLGDMDGGFVKVYDGGRKTAANRGSLLEQAVSFQSRYRLIGSGAVGTALNNYDLSMGAGELGATVTYTIFTP